MIKACYQDTIVEVVYKDKFLESSLIIIPQEAKKRESAYYGLVKAKGPDNPFDEIQVGDRIMFGRHEGFEVEHNEKTYLVLKPERVFAKIEGNEECNIRH